MHLVRAAAREHDLRISDHVERACLGALVVERDAADFGIVLGTTTISVVRREVTVAAHERRQLIAEPRLVEVGLDAERLVAPRTRSRHSPRRAEEAGAAGIES